MPFQTKEIALCPALEGGSALEGGAEKAGPDRRKVREDIGHEGQRRAVWRAKGREGRTRVSVDHRRTVPSSDACHRRQKGGEARSEFGGSKRDLRMLMARATGMWKEYASARVNRGDQ